MKNIHTTTPVLLISIIAIVIAILAAIAIWQTQVRQSRIDKTTSTREQNATAAAEEESTIVDEKDALATISGKAVYPSDGYPTDYKVCVVSKTSGAEIICDTSMAGKTGAAGYNVQVTPGTYQVVAKTAALQGYHDQYMKDDHYQKGDVDICDVQYHTPIDLEARAGEELANIHAGNFYYVPENCQSPAQ